MAALAPILQSFFTDRLINQRRASGNTIAAYRDTLRMLLMFTTERTGRAPSQLDLADLDAPHIAAFLEHLENTRGNSIRTRNARLAAIHSLFAYTALRHPEHAALISRVLAIPAKRGERNLVTYLTEAEADAFLRACNTATWTGRRDQAMLLTAIQTGLRISELTSLTCVDVQFGVGANVHCIGKGRKERRTPLLPGTVKVLRAWFTERRGCESQPLFPTITGRALSRDAVERCVALYTGKATATCPSIADKHVTAHTLRHTAAMRLLQSGVDITVIALWLGHEHPSTAGLYLHADMTQKERAIAKTTPPDVKPGRYQPADILLSFLEAL